MKILYQKGITHFGENRVDSLLNKQPLLKDLGITWHFIGRLQSNKVKQVINHIDVLHSLDRLELAKAIQKERIKTLDCFIQVNATQENQKGGIDIENIETFLIEMKKYDKINIIGFMTMGKLDDIEASHCAFQSLNQLKNKYQLPFLSMGMSDDYEVAIKDGATHIRIGRKIDEVIARLKDGLV